MATKKITETRRTHRQRKRSCYMSDREEVCGTACFGRYMMQLLLVMSLSGNVWLSLTTTTTVPTNDEAFHILANLQDAFSSSMQDNQLNNESRHEEHQLRNNSIRRDSVDNPGEEQKHFALVSPQHSLSSRKGSEISVKRTSNESYPQSLHMSPSQSKECRTFDHSVKTPTHGCEVNSDTFVVYCQFQNMRLDPDMVQVERGGENLTSVMGRREASEIPRYSKGAFKVGKVPDFAFSFREHRYHMYHISSVLDSMQYPTKANKGDIGDTSCSVTWPGTTLFVTRYEYVNMYHTATDWWNLVSVLQRYTTNGKKVRIVFLDGHAQGNLDSVWQEAFGEYTYVKQLPTDGSICFEEAVFVPPGYAATIYPPFARLARRQKCPFPQRAIDFQDYFLQAYGLQHVQRVPGKVFIIDRQPYVSHPRSKAKSLSRTLTILPKLADEIRSLEGVTSVELVRLEKMSFKEQLHMAREAHVLLGYHGAGLTHMLFMDKSAHIIEITHDKQVFFLELSAWVQAKHTLVKIANANVVQETELHKCVETVDRITTSSPSNPSVQ